MTWVTIVPATANILAPLASVLAPDPLFVRYGQTAAALVRQWRHALAAGDGLLVAHQAGQPAGLAWYDLTGAFATSAYLRLLAVAKAHQRQAIGVSLLTAFEDRCVQANSKNGCFLLCSAFNTAAQIFYHRCGYREVGQLQGFVLPDVTEIIFWKPPVPHANDTEDG